nr:MAG TPA: tail tape measure [Caudoviricetes sp.]
MAKSVDERVVSLKLEDGQFQKGVARVNKSLGHLKDELEFKNSDKGFKNLERASNNVKFDKLNKSAKQAGESLTDMSKTGSKSAKDLQKSLDDIKIDKVKESTDKLGDSMGKLGDKGSPGINKTKANLNSLNTEAAKTGALLSNVKVDTAQPNNAIASIKAKVSELGAHISGVLSKTKVTIPTGGATRALANLQKSVDSFQTRSMDNAVQGLGSKFEHFGIVAVTAIATLTNQAVQYGEKFLSGYIQPMKDGLSEYELQLNSVQTIMANTEQMPEWMGKSSEERLKAVNSTLDDLNKYADETIYNFSQMTHNIGTFTAAGVGLKDSASAIKGISNLAAVSGSNAQQASNAMYQLSQALASGTVKLQDWNSVVWAGMGGTGFQKQLIQTARVMGENVDEAIEKEGSFKDSLSKGWLTDKVLIETLKQYAGELNEAELHTAGYNDDQIKQILQLGHTATDAATEVKTLTQLIDTYKEEVGSGWTDFWGYIFGDFNQARKGWTSVHKRLVSIVNDSSNARNAIAKSWSEHGGTEDLYKTINNVLDAFIKLKGIVTKAWRDVFPPKDIGGAIYKVTHFIEQLTEKLIISDKVAEIMTKGLKFIFTALRLVLTTIKNVINAIREFVDFCIKSVKTFASWVLGLKSVREAIQWVNDSFNKAKQVIETFNKGFQDFVNSFKKGNNDIKSNNPGTQVTNQFKQAFEGLKAAFKPVIDLINTFGSQTLDGLYQNSLKTKDAIKAFADSFRNLGDDVRKAGEDLGDSLREKLRPIQEFAEHISEYIQKLGALIGEAVAWIKVKLKLLGHYIRVFFSDLNGHITADNILSLFTSGFILALIKNLNSLIKLFIKGTEDTKSTVKKFKDLAGSIDKLFKKIGDSFEHLSDSIDFSRVVIFAGAMKVLASALTELASIPAEKIATALGALTVCITELVGALAILGGIGAVQKKGKDGKAAGNLVDYSVFTKDLAIGMIALSGSVLILAKACSYFKGMDPGEIGLAVGAVTALMTVVTGSLIALGRFSKGTEIYTQIGPQLPKFATMIVGLGIGIILIAKAAQIFSTIDTTGLVKAGVSILVASAAIGVMLFALSKITKQFDTYREFTSNDKDFVQWGSTIKGYGFAIIEIASAFVIVGIAMKIISTIDTGGWLKAMGAMLLAFVGICTIIGTIAAAGKYLDFEAKELQRAAVSFMAIGAAFMLMATSMAILSAIPADKWQQSMVSITSLMLMMGGLSLAMSRMDTAKAVPGIIAIAGAISMMIPPILVLAAVPVEALTKSMAAIGALMGGIAIISRYMDGSDPTRAALSMIGFVTAINLLVPALLLLAAVPAAQLAKSLAVVATALAGFYITVMLLGPSAAVLKDVSLGLIMFGASLTLIGVGLVAISAGLVAVAAAVTSLVVIIEAGCTAIFAVLPILVKSFMNAVIGILQVITAALPTILECFGKIIAELLVFLVEQIPAIVEATLEIVDKVLAQIADHAPAICNNLVIILCAILNAVAGHADEIVGAAGNVAKAIISAIVKALSTSNTNAVADMILTMTAMSLLFKLMSKMKSDVKGALIVAGSILLIMTGLVGVFALMSKIDSSTVLQSALAMVSVATALSVAMIVFSNIPITAVLPALGSFALAMAGITAIIAAAAAIMSIPGIDAFMSRGVRLFEIIGQAIGAIFGGLAEGIIDAVSGSLPVVATNLSRFMTNLKPFVDGASDFDEGTISSIKNLVEAIALITASNILDAIGSFITGGRDISKFGETLVPLGQAMKDYADSVDGLNIEAINTSVKGLNALNKVLESVPKTGGVAGFLSGNVDWATLSGGLKHLGACIVDYSKSVSDESFSVDAIQNSVPALKALSKVLEAVPKTGGAAGWWTGNKNWANISSGLEGLGNALKAYNKTIGNSGTDGAINVGRIKDSVGAVQALSAVMNSLPDDPNNWFQAFTGNSKKWSTVSTGLADLGKALGAYSKSVSDTDLNYSAIDRASTTARDLINTINQIQWDGNIHLVGFQSSATNLGRGLFNFYRDIPTADVSFDEMVKAANAGSTIVNIINKLPDSIDKNLNNFPSIASTVGKGIAAFGKVKSLNNIDWDDARNAAKVGGDLIKIVNGYSDVKKIDFGSFNTMCTNLGAGLADYATRVSTINYETLSASIKPVKSLLDIGQQNDAASTFQNFVTACANLSKGVSKFNGDSKSPINGNQISASVNAVKQLLQIMANFGDATSTYENFGKASDNLAFGLQKFNQATTILQGELPALKQLIGLFNSLSNSIKNLPSDYSNVDSFVTAVNKLGTIDLKSLSTSLSDVSTTITQSFQNLVNSLSQDILDLSVELGGLRDAVANQSNGMSTPFINALDSMKSGMTTTSNRMTNFITAMGTFATNVGNQLSGTQTIVSDKMNKINQILSDAATQGKQKGNELGSNIKEGFKAGYAHLGAGFKAKIDGVLNTLSSARSTAYQSGVYLTQGFAAGIQSPLAVGQVASAAASIANTAIAAIKAKGKEGSPWKTTIQSGRFAAQGLAIGIKKDADLAKTESVKMVSGALSSFDRVLSNYDFNAEYTPSIKPVVDLSDLKTSTESISTLMDTTANVGLDYSTTKELARKVGQVRNSTQEMRQYQSDMIASNQTVTDAINSLRDDVSNIDLTKQPPTELYIDGRKLASTIAKPMDQALGLRQRRGI